MVVGIIFMLIAWLVIFVAEACKSNAFYRATAIFRVLGMLYVTSLVMYGIVDPAGFQTTFGLYPVKFILAVGLAGGYDAVMFLVELYRPHKYYASYLDVPRQILYKVGKYGKCQVLSEKEAKIAHEKGETVYIHAMARVTYKPKPAEEKVDTAKGKDTEMFMVRDSKGNIIDVKKGRNYTQEEIQELIKFMHANTKMENPK